MKSKPSSPQQRTDKRLQADWELDFYSRPVLEPDGKKRWELLICNAMDSQGEEPFRWEKRCPAEEVNSLWLAASLREALEAAEAEGWAAPKKIRCWRSSMGTMVQRAAAELDLDVIASRRTYALLDWLIERNRDLYPKQKGYLAGPLAPTPDPIPTPPVPLPDAVQGDAWSWASLPIGLLRDAKDWPMGFSGLLPVAEAPDDTIPVPGLRLFSRKRALALAGWLGGLEPVRMLVENNQLLLEAGQDDRWLVTEMDADTTNAAQEALIRAREDGRGLQFISVQATPDDQRFEGFWMLRDLPEP